MCACRGCGKYKCYKIKQLFSDIKLFLIFKHDYRIRFERFEVSDLDPEYITSKAWTSKINRTEFGANAYFNILKQCPLDAIVRIYLY